MSDLESAFGAFFGLVGHRDLGGFVADWKREAMSWKTAAKDLNVLSAPLVGNHIIVFAFVFACVHCLRLRFRLRLFVFVLGIFRHELLSVHCLRLRLAPPVTF